MDIIVKFLLFYIIFHSFNKIFDTNLMLFGEQSQLIDLYFYNYFLFNLFLGVRGSSYPKERIETFRWLLG